MKKLVPILLLVALALSFGVAGAKPPSPNAGWVHADCDNGLVFDAWLGYQEANAGHLADGRIAHLRSLYRWQDGEWVLVEQMPGKGVERIWCDMTVDWDPGTLFRGEIDIDPPG